MICRVCESESRFAHQAKILRKYIVRYYYCDQCEYLQTEDPYWLDEAYQDPVNIYDTGILSRNILLAETASTIINFWFNLDGKFLDYAGGYGIFVRLMRDYGYNFYWNDPYCQNIFARGFEIINESEELTMVTCFEAFEHFSYPLVQIQQVIKKSSNILFSTLLLPDPIPQPDDWWYYGFDHGQHVGFFRKKTLQYLANRFSLDLFTDNHNLHLLTQKSLFPQAVPESWNGKRKLWQQILSSDYSILDLFLPLWNKLKTRIIHRSDRSVLIQLDRINPECVKDPKIKSLLDDLFRYLISQSKHLNQSAAAPRRDSKTLKDMNDLIGRFSVKV